MLFVGFQVLERQSKEDLVVAAEQNVNVSHLDNIKGEMKWNTRKRSGPNIFVLKSEQSKSCVKSG
jgi:hypothetical protein